MSWGRAGRGEWITVYANSGHAYAVIAGLRFDTSAAGASGGKGPRWRSTARSSSGYTARHPAASSHLGWSAASSATAGPSCPSSAWGRGARPTPACGRRPPRSRARRDRRSTRRRCTATPSDVLGEALDGPPRRGVRRHEDLVAVALTRAARRPSARSCFYGGRVDLYQVHNLVALARAADPDRVAARRRSSSAARARRTTSRRRSASSPR